jgi:hypothetical protein
MLSNADDTDDGTTRARIESLEVHASLLDSGADDSVVSRGCIEKLEQAGAVLAIAPANADLLPVGDHDIPVHRKVRFAEVILDTSAGPLVLRNLDCFVHEEDENVALTISRLVMQRLGYSTDGLLAAARTRQPEYCLTADPLPTDAAAVPTPLVRMQALRVQALREIEEECDDADELVTTPMLVAATTMAVQEALELKMPRTNPRPGGAVNTQNCRRVAAISLRRELAALQHS